MVLTGDELLSAFRKRLDSSVRVDIATAWATEGDALTALLESTEREEAPAKVRVIVGLHGYTTTPGALRKLRRSVDLRVVPGEPLFHPKVYIFSERNGKRLAWVGSANLTGKGFGSNEEVMFQTRSTTPLVAWFKRQWSKVGPLDSRLLKRYIDEHEHPQGAHDERLEEGGLPRPRRLRFHSDGRAKDGYLGVCDVLTQRGKPNEKLHYASHVEAVEQVIARLTGEWRHSEALRRIERGFKIRSSGRPLVARRQRNLHRKETAVKRGQQPRELNGWWLSHDTTSPQKRRLIVAVAEICGVGVVWDDGSKYGF